MSIEFQCDGCQRLLSVPDGTHGKACVCPGCSKRLTIPMPVAEPELEVLYQTHCPNCQHVLIYGEALEGTRGLCKACNHIFTITQTPVAATSAPDSFPFECPACHKLFEGRAGFEGRKGKCDQCQAVFIIEPIAPKPAPAAPLPTAAPTPTAAPVQTPSPTAVNNAGATPRPVPTPSGKPLRPAVKKTPPASTNAPTAPSAFEEVDDTIWQDISSALPTRNVREEDLNWDLPENPYQPPAESARSSSRPRYPGLFQKAFQLAMRDLLMATWNMFLVNLVMSLCMMPVALLFGGFIALFGPMLDLKHWPGYAVGILILLMIIPMVAISLYFLPAFWNIALRYVSGKEVNFSSAIERKDIASRFVPWMLIQAAISMLVSFILGSIFTVILFGVAQTKSPGLMVFAMLAQFIVAGLVTVIASTPFLLAPFAWLDRIGFMDSLGVSFRYTTRHPVVFLGLTLTGYILGLLITLVTCGVANIFVLSLILLLHAAYYKLVKAADRAR
ncbi:MAG: hypothetical protein ACK5OB_09375 [Pirellula sp.]